MAWQTGQPGFNFSSLYPDTISGVTFRFTAVSGANKPTTILTLVTSGLEVTTGSTSLDPAWGQIANTYDDINIECVNNSNKKAKIGIYLSNGQLLSNEKVVRIGETFNLGTLSLGPGRDIHLRVNHTTPCDGESTTADWQNTETTDCRNKDLWVYQKDKNPCSPNFEKEPSSPNDEQAGYRWFLPNGNINHPSCACNGESTTPVCAPVVPQVLRCIGTFLERQMQNTNTCSTGTCAWEKVLPEVRCDCYQQSTTPNWQPVKDTNNQNVICCDQSNNKRVQQKDINQCSPTKNQLSCNGEILEQNSSYCSCLGQSTEQDWIDIVPRETYCEGKIKYVKKYNRNRCSPEGGTQKGFPTSPPETGCECNGESTIPSWVKTPETSPNPNIVNRRCAPDSINPSILNWEARWVNTNTCSTAVEKWEVETPNAYRCKCPNGVTPANFTDVSPEITRCATKEDIGFNVDDLLKQQRDTNVCSATYNSIRWILKIAGGCEECYGKSREADWKVVDDKYICIKGIRHYRFKDVNSCSNTFGKTQRRPSTQGCNPGKVWDETLNGIECTPFTDNLHRFAVLCTPGISTFTIVPNSVVGGTVTLNNTETFVFTPAQGAKQGKFNYQLRCNNIVQSTATITIKFLPPPDLC